MKLTTRNFGPIREFQTDLSTDFLLIVGENNIGKSYAISLIYCITKTLVSNIFLRRHLSPLFVDGLDDTLDEVKYTLSKLDNKSFDITPTVRAIAKNLLDKTFVNPLSASLQGTFGDLANLQNKYSNEESKIELSGAAATITLTISKGSLEISALQLRDTFELKPSKQNRSSRKTESKCVIYANPEATVRNDNAWRILGPTTDLIRSIIADGIDNIVDVHYLPASRSGLYQALSAFGQIVAELSRRRTFLSQRIELPGISEPLSDYFLKLTEIRPSPKDSESKYIPLAHSLETSILKGSVEFDPKNKRLMYKPQGANLRLELSATSSMVSEVAPIVTYLKHVLPERERQKRTALKSSTQPKQILFIEEPEAHLHPQNQVLLMDIFAKLVAETGTQIVMTSHSNFVFNKLSNLVMANSFGSAKAKAVIFERGEKGTTCRQLEIDEYGISDENFVDTASVIYEEKLGLIDSINKKKNDNKNS
jgi:AAA15 family ATPase/GTPase